MSTVILATADPQTQWSKLTLSNPHHTETVSPSFNPFSPYPSLNLFMFNHDTINILRTFLQNFTPSGVPPPPFFSPLFQEPQLTGAASQSRSCQYPSLESYNRAVSFPFPSPSCSLFPLCQSSSLHM